MGRTYKLMNNQLQQNKALKILNFVVCCVLILFIALPLFFVLFSCTKDDFIKVFSSVALKSTIKNTLIECICSSFFSVVIGFLYAYAVLKAKFPCKKFFRFVPLLHLITPPFVGGLSFVLLLGRQGLITNKILGLDVSIYGFWGLLIAQVLCFFPMAYLICLQSIQNINPNLEKSAKSMGAGRFKIFCSITLRLSFTGILCSFLFIAVSVLSDFANPLIVGGRFRVLSVEIYTQLTSWLNVGVSAVLGIILIIPSIILFFLQNRFFKLNQAKFSTIGERTSFSSTDDSSCVSKVANIFLFGFVLIISLIILMQFVSIIVGAFQKLWGINTAFTFEHIINSFKYSKELFNSLFFALIAAFCSTVLAIFCAFVVNRSTLFTNKIIDTLSQLPSAIPGTLIGFSLSVLSNILDFRFSALMIIITMTISFLPFAYKSVIQTYSQISQNLDKAAFSLGASPLKMLKTVLLPLSKGGIYSGFIYSFIRGCGTLSAVIFLVSFNTPLASVKILNLAEEGFWGRSCALALLLTCGTFAVIMITKLVQKLISLLNKNKQIV